MKVTNLSLKKQIKLVEKTQTLCNEIISLKYTQPEKRDKLLKNFLLQPNPLKRDLKLLQQNSLIELYYPNLSRQLFIKSNSHKHLLPYATFSLKLV